MPRPARGPYLKPDANGIYQIHHTERGRSRVTSARTRDPVEAQKALADYILAYREVTAADGLTVGQGWKLYWAEHVERRCAAAERLDFAWRALSPTFADRRIRELTADDFEAYTRARLARVAPPTVRRELSALTAAFNHLRKTKRITLADLPYIPMPPAGAPRDRWLTAEEIATLELVIDARAQGDRLSRLQRFVAIALATGARARSIEKLLWDRVDLQRGLINFDHGGPQTKKRRPTVPISDALRPVLERAWAERTGPCVLDHTGSIRKAFERAVAAAGLEDVTRHTLRHTWATHASMAGVALVDIARVLGNSLAMVQKVYAHHQPEYLRAAVNFTPRSYAPAAGNAGVTG